MRNLFPILAMLMALCMVTPVFATTVLTNCTVISSPDTYVLANDVINFNVSTCMDVEISDVLIDCQGHLMSGGGSASYGVYIPDSISITNVTVKNCVMDNVGTGMYLAGGGGNSLLNSTVYNSVNGAETFRSNNNVIANSHFFNNSIGIYDYKAWYNNYTLDVIENNSDAGYSEYLSQHNNLVGLTVRFNTNGLAFTNYAGGFATITNSSIYNNTQGLFFTTYSDYPMLVYNNFFNNTNNVIIGDGNPNYFNDSVGGNYWALPNGTGFSETCNCVLGICDAPYNLSDTVTDYLPLCSPTGSTDITWTVVTTNMTAWTSTIINPCVIPKSGSSDKLNCTLWVDGMYSHSITNLNNNTQTCLDSSALSDGAHMWYYNCTDDNNASFAQSPTYKAYSGGHVSGCFNAGTVEAGTSSSLTYYLDNNITDIDKDPCISIYRTVAAPYQTFTLNCQNYWVIGDGAGTGIYASDSGVSGFQSTTFNIFNCKSMNSNNGIYLYSSRRTNVSNLEVTNSSSYGLYIRGGTDFTGYLSNIRNILVYNNAYGFYLYPSRQWDVISNVTGYNNAYGFYEDTGAAISGPNTIENLWFYNNTYGIYFNWPQFPFIKNANVLDNTYGIYLSNPLYALSLYNNTISRNTYGISIDSPDNNIVSIYNNLLNNTNNIVLSGTYESKLVNFNTTNQTGTRIYGNGLYIGGNYYTNSTSNEYSDTCADTDRDGFCDSPLNITTMTSCNPDVDLGDDIDYLPLSLNYIAPPVISFHDDITAEATSASGAIVTYTNPTATDDVDGSVTVSCSPVSDSTFVLGTTKVECSATDSHGNTATSSFYVIVQDTTAPLIDAHGDEIIETTNSLGATVSYTSPATYDLIDGNGTATCMPASGSTFSPGGTIVTCNANDTAGNAAIPTTFKVTVIYNAPVVNSGSSNVGNSGTFVGGGIVTCTENWSCTDWTLCTGGIQTRICTDKNKCGTTKTKPIESQSCTLVPPVCTENWTCTDWSACVNDKQTRVCTDTNSCGTVSSKPSESQDCATEAGPTGAAVLPTPAVLSNPTGLFLGLNTNEWLAAIILGIAIILIVIVGILKIKRKKQSNFFVENLS